MEMEEDEIKLLDVIVYPRMEMEEDEIRLLDVIVYPVPENRQQDNAAVNNAENVENQVIENRLSGAVIMNNRENLENRNVDEDYDDYIEIIELDDDEDTESSQDSVVILDNSENVDNQQRHKMCSQFDGTENSHNSVVIMNNSENAENQDAKNSQDSVVIMNNSENVDNQVTENRQDSVVIMNNAENEENQDTEKSQDSVVMMNNSENVDNQVTENSQDSFVIMNNAENVENQVTENSQDSFVIMNNAENVENQVTENSQDSFVIMNNAENVENQVNENSQDSIVIMDISENVENQVTENSQDSFVIMNNAENVENQVNENSQDSIVIMDISENVENQVTENSQDSFVIMNHAENVENQVNENSQDSIVVMNNSENVENQVTENIQDSVVIMNNSENVENQITETRQDSVIIMNKSENVENQINKTPDISATEGHKKLVVRIETISIKNCIIHIENCREQAIALGAKWPEKDEECEDVSDDDDDVHKIVWGLWNRKRKTYYPAITYHKNNVNADYIPIIWFGENQVSTMRRSSIFPFRKHFVEKYNANNESIRKSVHVTLELMAKMSGKHYNDNQLISWAVNGFKGFKKDYSVLNDFLSPILQKVKENEEKSKTKRKQKTDGQHHRKKQRKVEEEESDAETDGELTVNLPELLKTKNMKDICLYCNRLDRELVPHPIFEGALCKYKCSKKYKANIFVIGNDQKQVCCTICGRAGELTVCDTENCTKSYCQRCLKSFLKEEHVQKIKESPQWHCFLCTNEILENCVLKIQTQWNIELLQFLDDNKHRIRYTDFANKGPINVLSLFDGIGTGLQALKDLGIKVNKYYASEIDENAITVAKMNHKDSIIHIGDINNISRERLHILPKIDLVLGGSPCNDFSLANPARKNIEESSESRKLFSKFMELLTIVKEQNSNTFYLFENVCPMEKKTLDHIRGAFNNEEPANIDAKHFSPMKRSRYFWGNIPGLHGIPEFWSTSSERPKFTLQDYLEPDLNRTATMETIKTVTSQPNSLIQKGKKLPVVMGDKPSQLWAKELERLFGFPVHYTEANLNPNQRLALLGKSWSVQVIKSILCPLKNFFECN